MSDTNEGGQHVCDHAPRAQSHTFSLQRNIRGNKLLMSVRSTEECATEAHQMENSFYASEKDIFSWYECNGKSQSVTQSKVGHKFEADHMLPSS